MFALIAYDLGSFICHQRAERSFRLASVPMPVCARCTGIYAGAALALATALVVGRLRNTKPKPAAAGPQSPEGIGRSTAAVRLALLAAVTPALLTLVYEWTTGRAPSNEVRAATGVVLGAIVAWQLFRLE